MPSGSRAWPRSALAAACSAASRVSRATRARFSSTRCGHRVALTTEAQTMPRQISVQRATAWSNTCSGTLIAGRAMIATV